MNSKMENAVWGRSNSPSWFTQLIMFFLLFGAPGFALFFNISIVHYKGSLLETWKNLPNIDIIKYIQNSINVDVLSMTCLWILIQAFLAILPDYLHELLPWYKGGIQEGQTTPAGYTLKYNINGLQSWIITHGVIYLLVINGYLDPTIIAYYWGELFIVANIIGFVISLCAYIKAYISPSYIEDNKVTDSFIYNYTMGIEFNPRCGPIDIKLFFNGRPGIFAWTSRYFGMDTY